ncbi:MAG: HAMP domain-containing sensor histidine kinase [Chloroflexota bacterium]|nr:HAMP domain-containing sensor histidine kinase [Chloroflexota bacterium]
MTPSDRLVRRTSRGLAFVTLALIAALLAGVGLVTAAVAVGMTNENVDRTLEQVAAARLTELETLLQETDQEGQPTQTSSPETENGSADGETSDEGETGVTPVPTAAPTPAPTATPVPSGLGLLDSDEAQLESFQTFYLVLDTNANVLSNPQQIKLAGLPDAEAAAAATRGDDLRTVTVGSVHIRLLTERVLNTRGDVVALLQTGFLLTQHDQQTSTILVTIVLASLIGLLGAAVVTLVVTTRAMGPIRSAFNAERRFVASASHELRTPVAVVRASAEVLQRENLVRPDGQRLVADIVSESDRLGRLVGDLLALASADAGAIVVKPEEIEMRGFVAELAHRAGAIASERGVRLQVVQQGATGADRELLVRADPDRMTQLLLIFIDNAIDHSPADGTIRLVVAPLNDGRQPQVSIGVADQGPGVPVHERLRIFEPFARLAGRRRETGNTGLGLAIARVLAARQDATLHVDDATGGGAVFSVWLPRRTATGAAAAN